MTRLEVAIRRGDMWRVLGTIGDGDREGSMSSITPAGRQIYVFGWRDGLPGVWRSESGIDVETGDIRVVSSFGWEEISDLEEPLELDVETARAGTVRARFQLIEVPA